ncbi:MAG TPA: MFS transporter, partial [Pseudoxanthomonas sp.]|nr:MFS transporter [Pseudoxanthomonas sp.]
FPAAIKAVTDWFPRRERALAVGILNAGANVGAMLTPLIVPAIVLTLGWRWAFIVTGGLGLFWLIAWLAIYRRPEETPQLSARELAHIRSSSIETGGRTPWLGLLRHRQTWAYAVGKFLTDPIWWLYLFWLPDFFSRGFHLDLKSFAIPLVVVYLSADIGSVGGGWLSSRLMQRGRSPNAARKLAMLVCALAVLPVALAPRVHDVWTAVALISLAAAAHQGWSANLLTLPSDLFPGRVVSSVVGLGGMFGAIGGMLIAKVASAILQQTGSYVPVFLIAGTAYLAALLLIHSLVPRMQPAKLD